MNMADILEYIALGNGVLLASCLIVWLFEITLRKTRFRHAYRLRLNLVITALCTVALPFILAPITGAISSTLATNANDFVASQYLKGNISLSATQVADVLSAKNGLIDNLISATSVFSILVIAIFAFAACMRTAYIGMNIIRVFSLVKNAKQMIKVGRIFVWSSSDTDTPFSTRGFFRYHIVFPASMVNDRRAISIALGHEAQHIRQHDVDLEILLSLISPLFVLNPAFWYISDRIRRFREYSCDAAFLSKARCETKEYCFLLLDIASKAARNKTTALAGSVPFWGSEGFFKRSTKSALRQRVIALTSDNDILQTGAARYLNVIPASLLLASIVTMIAFVAKPTDWSHDRLMLSTVVNLERLERINGGGFGVRPLR